MEVSVSPQRSGRKKDAIELLLAKPPMIVRSAISQLRYLVLVDGLTVGPDGQCAYRPYVWSVLLRSPPMKSSSYLSLVKRGPCIVYSKIRNDTFRTMTTDAQFRKKVFEDALIRVLNSYAWNQSAHRSETGKKSYQHSDAYVQGMNVLCAPFMYVARSEAQAYALFETLLTRDCPLYVEPTMPGVHTGLALLDMCLEIIDPKLYEFLRTKFLTTEVYGFASVLTFSACTPPLSEVLILWDFLFAYGVHMNILFVVAQLNLMRNELLQSPSPISLLRSFPPLRAKEIIKLGISFVTRLPAPIYNLLARHSFDPTVPSQLDRYKRKSSN
ncbi:mitotic check point protein Bub2p [Trichomonascus vanleenenianus]|uniref:Bub2p n=1 Tax=Trichomonascus vanleenenianus TaxID=2268995 RepID=UPI003ECB6CC9